MSHRSTYVRVCLDVCERAGVCMNNEITPFSGFLLSHYVHLTYILTHFLSFLSCGIIFSLFLCTCGAFDSGIKSRSLIFT